MRIFNRVHVPWAIFVCLATIAASILYLANFHPNRLPFSIRLPGFFGEQPPSHHSIGGTPLGLIFGAVSLAIFIFATLLGVRKKVVLWRIGTVQRWLRAHIWLTLLTIPLVVLHSGFRLGGPMTTLLMTLYGIVMVSGLYGLALQHQMPRLMKERLPAETVFEQIPHICRQLYAAAEKMRDSLKPLPAKPDAGAPAVSVVKPVTAGSTPMASTAGETSVPSARAKTAAGSTITEATVGPPAAVAATPVPAPAATTPATVPPKPAAPSAAAADPASEAVLVEFIDQHILPYLGAKRGSKLPLGKARYSDDLFRFIKLRVAETYRSRVEEIQAWCDERRMLDLQTRLHHWLHGWLFIHVPFSFLLLMFTVWHAFVTLFYY